MPRYAIAEFHSAVKSQLTTVTNHYTNEDLRLIRREARQSPDRVTCPRCSLRVGRPVVLKVQVSGILAKFTCPTCGENTQIALERTTDT